MTYSNILRQQLRCTSCANVLCDLEACKCGCHKMNMIRTSNGGYVQNGNGAVHLE